VLQALKVERYAFTSPYVATLNNLAIKFIESFGMTCVSRVDAPAAMSNEAVGDTRPDEIVDIALDADCDSAQAIVISCTDYRATEAIEEIEARLGKPVITSNQASLLVGLSRLGIPLGDSALQQHLAASCFDQLLARNDL
jgi:maleate cis-trans isomerase